jgi:2-methylisocitrate lyase-like PEP mutase family enzyme
MSESATTGQVRGGQPDPGRFAFGHPSRARCRVAHAWHADHTLPSNAAAAGMSPDRFPERRPHRLAESPRHTGGNLVEAIQKLKAQSLRALHDDGVLILPNAWDAGSAALIARAGAKAIATTSGGIAWSLGRPDGQRLTRAEMIEPVVAAGAAGVNIEDSRAPGGPLFAATAQAERVRAARSAADRAKLPELLINVRTDVFLFRVGAPEGRLDDVLLRSSAYAEAGADSLLVPGLADLDIVTSLVQMSPLPINVMAGPGAPTIAEFEAAGVRRVSVGTAISQAAYSIAQRAATELLTKGTYTQLEGALNFGTINATFSR